MSISQKIAAEKLADQLEQSAKELRAGIALFNKETTARWSAIENLANKYNVDIETAHDFAEKHLDEDDMIDLEEFDLSDYEPEDVEEDVEDLSDELRAAFDIPTKNVKKYDKVPWSDSVTVLIGDEALKSGKLITEEELAKARAALIGDASDPHHGALFAYSSYRYLFDYQDIKDEADGLVVCAVFARTGEKKVFSHSVSKSIIAALSEQPVL